MARARAQRNIYVDGRAGWRVFFFTLAFAMIAGLSLRLYFNPNRIRAWLDEALASQGAAIGLRFDGAQLELARGSVPEFAVMMSGVEATPAGNCGLEPSIRIAKLRVPLNIGALLQGRAAIGTVSAEDMQVDLDGLKTRCPSAGAQAPPPRAVRSLASDSEGAKPAAVPPASPGASAEATPNLRWWTPEQINGIREVVGGFEFSRVELLFENKTKKIYLESFAVEPGEAVGEVRVETDVIVPSELTYGEQVPPLKIDARAFPEHADVRVRANLSEGHLLASAKLTPATNARLSIEAQLGLDNVPLSTLIPLVSKSGIVGGTFRPKFMWMNCQAEIRGYFQGLLTDNPLNLANCRIEGNGAHVSLEKATRHPDGRWAPFTVDFSGVDINQLMDTFDWQGPVGTFSEFGRMTGKVNVARADEADLDMQIEGAQLRVSNRNVRAFQELRKLGVHLDLRGEKLHGEVNKIELEDGSFDGSLQFLLERKSQRGSARLEIRKLHLSDRVNAVLIGGPVEAVSGRAEAHFRAGKLASLKSLFDVKGLEGRDVRFAHGTAQVELSENDTFAVNWRTDKLEFRRDSGFFRVLEPAFFTHTFADDWISSREVDVHAHVPPGGGLAWTSARGEVEGGKIKLSSVGAFTRDRELSGWLNVDYPAVKKLKWDLSGTTDEPELRDGSKALAELRRHAFIDDARLGLPRGAKVEAGRGGSSEGVSQDSSTTEAPTGLKAFSEKVMRKARGLMPKRRENQAVPEDAQKKTSDQNE